MNCLRLKNGVKKIIQRLSLHMCMFGAKSHFYNNSSFKKPSEAI